MNWNWGDVPGWIALVIVAVQGVHRFFSGRARRKRELEARTLSESDLNILREASKCKGLLTIDSNTHRGGVLVITTESRVYGNDPRPDVQAAYIAIVERMMDLGLLDHVGGSTSTVGRTRNYQLTDKAYQLLKEAPKSGEVVVSEFGE
jgi:hypothetical protein